MSYCGTAVGYTKDCDFPMFGGTERDVILLDYEDVKAELLESLPGITFDASLANLVTDFTFAASSGRAGYLVESNMNQIRPSYTHVQLNTGAFYTHSLTFHLPDNTAEADAFVKAWGDKRVVAIYKNKSKGEDGASKYKILGLGNGLVRTEASQDAYNENGVHVLTFASEENTPETQPLYTLFKTDEATTDAIWTALQTPA